MKSFIAGICTRIRRAARIVPRLWLLVLCAAPAGALAQQTYPDAAAAAEALVSTLRAGDPAALGTVLGADWKTFIPTDDADREDAERFLTEWDKSHKLDSSDPERVLISVGGEGWTLPIPIVKTTGGWQFDVQAGADDMKTRRIGRNELAAMQAAQAYFDAQKEYAQADRMGDGVLQYAQQFASSPGKHDGLYWPTGDDEPESPLGSLFVTVKPGEGYQGYRFKILKAQGRDAPGGAYDYVIKGRMVSGFALVARPLRYGDTGVMSFMISHDGKLYEKDLGEKSAEVVEHMTTFNPDSSWKPVSAEELGALDNPTTKH
jgi:hypothetical protein